MRRRQSFATVLIGKSVLVREGIAKILRAADFRTLASVSSVDEIPSNKLQPHQLLFLIVNTGDDFDVAVQQVGFLKNQHPSGRIAIVADHYRLDELVSALRAGANGYFVNLMTCDAFIKSIELVMMGETVFPPAFLSVAHDAEENRMDGTVSRDENSRVIFLKTGESIAPQLSPREKSILCCLIDGDSNKSIARKIDIAEATVKVHVKAILRKIRVQNRTQAAIWGMNNGSLTRPSTDNSLPSLTRISAQSSKTAEMLSEIKKTEAPALPVAINHANHVDVSPIDPFVRNGTGQRAGGTARLGK